MQSKTRSQLRLALGLAAQKGHTDIVRALLDAGADVEGGKDIGFASPLYFAAQAGHKDTVNLLLGRGADVSRYDVKLTYEAGHQRDRRYTSPRVSEALPRCTGALMFRCSADKRVGSASVPREASRAVRLGSLDDIDTVRAMVNDIVLFRCATWYDHGQVT